MSYGPLLDYAWQTMYRQGIQHLQASGIVPLLHQQRLRSHQGAPYQATQRAQLLQA